jgi:hypothetical protein
MEFINPDLFMNWVFLRRVERFLDDQNNIMIFIERNQRMQSISENLDAPENLEKD